MGKPTKVKEIGKLLDAMPKANVVQLAETMLKTYMLEVAATKRTLDPKVVRELRAGIKLLKSQP